MSLTTLERTIGVLQTLRAAQLDGARVALQKEQRVLQGCHTALDRAQAAHLCHLDSMRVQHSGGGVLSLDALERSLRFSHSLGAQAEQAADEVKVVQARCDKACDEVRTKDRERESVKRFSDDLVRQRLNEERLQHMNLQDAQWLMLRGCRRD
jgi:hypothetical protein